MTGVVLTVVELTEGLGRRRLFEATATDVALLDNVRHGCCSSKL